MQKIKDKIVLNSEFNVFSLNIQQWHPLICTNGNSQLIFDYTFVYTTSIILNLKEYFCIISACSIYIICSIYYCMDYSPIYGRLLDESVLYLGQSKGEAKYKQDKFNI